MPNYKIFSVDDHIIEPRDLWTSRLPARMAAEGPRVLEEDGREFWVYEDRRNATMGLNAVAGWPRERWSTEPARFTDMIPGCYDPAARARDLLSQGVFASVSFPTLPRFGGLLFKDFKDKELASACVKAWNDYVIEEWCPGGPPGMFVPMTICQVWDPALAAAEIRRCAERGSKALCFPEHPGPGGLPGFRSDFWDPIWEATEETGLVICMHIGSSGMIPSFDPETTFMSTTATAHINGMLAMTELLLCSVPRDYPGLRFVFSEAGVGWIPAILERCDRQWDRHAWTGRGGDTPSEVFRRAMFSCVVEEPIGLSLWELIGADKILAETDYPHSDTTYPAVQAAFAEAFAGIPEPVVEKVTHTNAERLFGWTMASEGLYDTPDIAAWRDELRRDPHAALRLAAPATSPV